MERCVCVCKCVGERLSLPYGKFLGEERQDKVGLTISFCPDVHTPEPGSRVSQQCTRPSGIPSSITPSPAIRLVFYIQIAVLREADRLGDLPQSCHLLGGWP